MYKRKMPSAGLPGSGAFETMRSYNGRIFRLSEHIDRFFESCNSLSLKSPRGKRHMRDMLRAALMKSGLKNTYIRLAIYGHDKGARFSIIMKPLAPYPAVFYRRGVTITTVTAKKLPAGCVSPKIKSSNFLTAVLAKIEAGPTEGFEPLMLSGTGTVAETAISNVFIIKGGVIMTPPAYIGILAGITRDVVLRIADRLGMHKKEVPLTRHDLYSADEVFLTSTIMEVMPVVSIDARKINDGKPGEITRILMEEYKNETRCQKD